jgi:hypothetical protein
VTLYRHVSASKWLEALLGSTVPAIIMLKRIATG